MRHQIVKAQSEQGALTVQLPAIVTPLGNGSYQVRPGRPGERKVLLVLEVAQKLGITKKRVFDLIDGGELEAFNIGTGPRRHWRVRADTLARFIHEHHETGLRPP